MEKLLLANKILKKDRIQEGITIYSKIINQFVAKWMISLVFWFILWKCPKVCYGLICSDFRCILLCTILNYFRIVSICILSYDWPYFVWCVHIDTLAYTSANTQKPKCNIHSLATLDLCWPATFGHCDSLLPLLLFVWHFHFFILAFCFLLTASRSHSLLFLPFSCSLVLCLCELLLVISLSALPDRWHRRKIRERNKK